MNQEEKVIILLDGSNFYHRLKEPEINIKNLLSFDYRKFAEYLTRGRKLVASQLFWYASGLSFRTAIPLRNFVCAWFDNYNYYEFNPKEAKIRFLNSKWRSNRKQILKEKATNFVSRTGNGFGKEFSSDWKGLKEK